MKKLMRIMLLFLVGTVFSFASSYSEHPAVGKERLTVEGQAVLQTIEKLESRGYLTPKASMEAKKELVFDEPSFFSTEGGYDTGEVTGEGASSIDYFGNAIKLLAVLSFLIAFRGFIVKFIYLFKRVPVWIYQSAVLSGTVCMTMFPENIWASEAFYIRNFGVIANLLVLFWIYEEYKGFFDGILKYISLKMPPKMVVSFYVMVYFGYFAIAAESQFLGIFALAGFVSVFGFSISGDGLTTYIGYDESETYMNVSMLVNGLVVALYSYFVINQIQIPYLEVFSVGIEYISTLAFVIALIINGSWWFSEKPIFGLSVLLMMVSFFGSLVSGIVYGLEVIPAIINTGFVIFLLGWLGWLSHKLGGIIMAFLVGLYLYGFALLVESKPEFFVTSLF